MGDIPDWLRKRLETSAMYPPDQNHKLTIPLDQCLRFLHLSKQIRISNNSRSIPDLSASLVQSRNNPHNRSFGNISQLNNLGKWLSYQLFPFVSNIPFPWPTHKQPRPTQLYISP
jgi:hypothetical protein